MKYSMFSIMDRHEVAQISLRAFYRQALAQCVLADDLGMYGYFLAEHHFRDYGVVPNPAMLLAAAAARTQHIRLGPAICVLPFHHPLRVAEDYAMLDQLSGGRLSMGVGSGYLSFEFEGFGVDPVDKRARFDESLAILEQAWRGEIHHRGEHYTIEGLRLNVPPLQRPSPPIHVAGLRRESAYHIARRGRGLFAVPYSTMKTIDDVGPLLQRYLDGRRDGGHMPDAGQAIFVFHAHVAVTDEHAEARAAAAFERYVRTRTLVYGEVPSYRSIQHTGLALFGSPSTVARRVLELRAHGVRYVALLMNFGGLDADVVADSMRRFAHEVIPLVEQCGAGACVA